MARSENNLNAVFRDTANAIRAKKESSDKITPRDFADEISTIQTGGTGTIEITTNGEHDVAQYGVADVNVPIPPGYIVPEGSISINNNNSYDVAQYNSVAVYVPYARTQSVTLNSLSSKVFGCDDGMLECEFNNYTYTVTLWGNFSAFSCRKSSPDSDIIFDASYDWILESGHDDEHGEYYYKIMVGVLMSLYDGVTYQVNASNEGMSLYLDGVTPEEAQSYLESEYSDYVVRFVDLLGNELLEIPLSELAAPSAS